MTVSPRLPAAAAPAATPNRWRCCCCCCVARPREGARHPLQRGRLTAALRSRVCPAAAAVASGTAPVGATAVHALPLGTVGPGLALLGKVPGARERLEFDDLHLACVMATSLCVTVSA